LPVYDQESLAIHDFESSLKHDVMLLRHSNGIQNSVKYVWLLVQHRHRLVHASDRACSIKTIGGRPSVMPTVSQSHSSFSEAVFKSELDLSHWKRKRGYDARSAWTVIDERIRLGKVRVIKHVEEFGSKLQMLAFGDGEIFAN
jgi:hypothetical protein